MTDSNIITGQYVRISQTPASIGSRIVAWATDAFAIMAYVFSMTILLEKTNTTSNTLFMVFVFLPAFLYSFLFELFNNGQSLGKMMLHIKVVKKDGTTPTMGDYFMRWLLLLIDVGMSGIGVIVILLNKNGQRLGDLAAGTMVIKLNNYHHLQVSLDEFAHLDRNYVPIYPMAEELTLNQVNVIQRTLDSSCGPERNNRIERLAQKVRNHLSITGDNLQAEKFLYTIIRDYQHYSLECI